MDQHAPQRSVDLFQFLLGFFGDKLSPRALPGDEQLSIPFRILPVDPQRGRLYSKGNFQFLLGFFWGCAAPVFSRYIIFQFLLGFFAQAKAAGAGRLQLSIPFRILLAAGIPAGRDVDQLSIPFRILRTRTGRENISGRRSFNSF